MRRLLYAAVIAICFGPPAGLPEQCAAAQDVVIDLESLDELKGYRPPPMFSGAPQERIILNKPRSRYNPYLPKPAPPPALLPHEEMAVTPAPAASIEPVEQIMPEPEHMRWASYPSPPRRPKILNASRDFVDQARRDNQMEALPAAPVAEAVEIRSEGPEVFIPLNEAEIQSQYEGLPPLEDSLHEQLVATDIEDILASIEGGTSDAKQFKTRNFRLAYDVGDSALSEGLVDILSGQILPAIQPNGNGRIEIRAYAFAVNGSEANARRLSLARALEVRAFLINHGIDARRIDVRPLGKADDKAAPDRVDILISGTG